MLFKKGFSIFRLVGFVLIAVVAVFFVFKAAITGSIV